MLWIFLAITAQALFAVSNFIDKFLLEKRIKDPLLVTILAGLASLVLGLLLFMVKGFQIISAQQCFFIIISGILLELYLIPYLRSLTIDDTSRVVPLFQFVPIFVLLLSYVILGEALSGKQWVGTAFIVAGSFVLSLKKFEKGIFKLRKSLWLMLLASLLYAITGILFKVVVITQDFWLTLAYECFGMGIGGVILLCIPAYRRGFQVEAKKLTVSTWRLLAVNQGVYVFALWLMFYAFLLTSVSLVSILNGVEPFFVLLYGYFLSIWFPSLIKEDIERHAVFTKACAILLIFMGGYLVYI